MSRLTVLIIAGVLALSGCKTAPPAPSVMVLPGSGKSLEQFQGDDDACRQWAGQQVTADTSPLMQRRYDIAYQQCMYSRGHQIPGVSRSDGPPPRPAPGPGQRVPAPPPGSRTPPPGAPPPPPGAPPPPPPPR